MLLEPAQKQLFISYLEREITSSEVLLAQMPKIKAPEGMMRMMQGRIMAYKVVLKDLMNVETQTIGG